MIGVSTVWTKENDRSGDPESMALIVYHPGLGEFPQRVVEGFTRGLQASGWSAVIWTASDSTPTDLTNFDLLVLGSPVYYWAPSRPVQGYLERVGDLR
jgi:menaquinone-dependent protoporphyrinogen IX oxidase